MRARSSRNLAWLASSLLAVAIVLLAALPSGRDTLSGLLGDDLRVGGVAFYSGLFERDPDTADFVPIDHADLNPYAVNVFLEQEVEEWKIRRTLGMARDAGFRWIKQQVRWSEIEMPAKGQFLDLKNGVDDTWLKFDRIVDLSREYGLEPIFRLDSSPEWARPGITKEETPPEHVEDFGDFVSAVVNRYRDRVRYYQIWNEPNLAFEWGGRTPNAIEYVALLRESYGRAKAADPDATIIAAALAPTLETSGRATNDLIFLEQMYDAGVKNWFDVMSANPYGLRSGPDDRRLRAQRDINFSRPILIREIMVRNGDAGKPIWASELGWNALPEDFPGEPPWGRVGREQQAAYTVRAYQRMQEEWPWMGVAALWHFRMVHDVNRDKPQYYFGIVENDFQPYPVYEAMKELATAEPIVYPGFHQESNWALAFDDKWRTTSDERASLGSARTAVTADARVTFAFKGSDLDLVVKRDDRSGRLAVSVDGGAYAANRLPRDHKGNAYLDLASSTENWQQRVAVSRGLPWGIHRVELATVPDGRGNSAASVDAVVVGGAPPNAPRQASAAFLGVLALGLVILARLRILRFVGRRGSDR